MKLTRKSADTNFVHFVSKVMVLMLKDREFHSRCSDLAEMQTPIRCVCVLSLTKIMKIIRISNFGQTDYTLMR